MRKLLLFSWLCAVLLPTFSQWGTIAYFQLNKEYIARVLCENRNRPELHCNGQCYLAKRLKAQQEKQDQQTTERVQNTPVFQLYTEPLLRFTFLPKAPVLRTKTSFIYQLFSYSAPLADVLHPPCQ
ncbi:hypothetical protein [Larkinella rosea]|uniref:Uncharacterized protein n=1 Tax=Larkinella rosea TaxID=2025312 RepID=A0A3P1BUI2_9BACT|nr:hypothetical protein [Larkinella rosea]RRB04546.1 hypothetical protein EHT25_13710 [Larkinella rosea]